MSAFEPAAARAELQKIGKRRHNARRNYKRSYPDKQEVVRAAAVALAFNVPKSHIADLLGISRPQFYRDYLPEVEALVEEEKKRIRRGPTPEPLKRRGS